MPSLPVVAIVGRPNVGKSTLFNRLVGERTAIISDVAGTTRDRVYGTAEWNGRTFTVEGRGAFYDTLRMELAEATSLRKHNGDRRSDMQDPEVARSVSEAIRLNVLVYRMAAILPV